MSPSTADGVMLGDGFIPFHFSVQVQNQDRSQRRFKSIVASLKALKSVIRRTPASELTIDSMLSVIGNVAGVKAVVPEGAYSSIAIPLFMFRSLSGQRTRLSGVMGTGPIAFATAQSIKSHGVEMVGKALEQGDTPIELSIRDDQGYHETIRLYPVSRTKYRHTFKLSQDELQETSGFMLTRHNQGRADVLRAVSEAGGFTSMRIAEPTRYVKLADYVSLLPHVDHVVISHRSKVLHKLYKHFDLDHATNGRGNIAWSETYGDCTNRLIEQIRSLASEASLMILILDNEVVLVPAGNDPLRYRAPANYDRRSRAARLQGAAAAIRFKWSERSFPQQTPAWQDRCNSIMQATYSGTEHRPSTYPDATFEPRQTWLY